MTRGHSLLAIAALALLASACGDDGSGSRDPEPPPATDEREPGDAADETGSDLPDPCEFATAAEVSAVIGTEVEHAGGGEGDFDGVVTDTCAYRAIGGEQLFASVQVLGGFDDPSEVRDTFAPFGDIEDAGIEGLPDSTFVTDVDGFRTTFVVDAAQPYGVNVSGGPDDDRPEQAEQLAVALYEPK